MVCSKLHVICGNCGCNKMFVFKIEQEGRDFEDFTAPEVYITCKNCSTVHPLSRTVPDEVPPTAGG